MYFELNHVYYGRFFHSNGNTEAIFDNGVDAETYTYTNGERRCIYWAMLLLQVKRKIVNKGRKKIEI